MCIVIHLYDNSNSIRAFTNKFKQIFNKCWYITVLDIYMYLIFNDYISIIWNNISIINLTILFLNKFTIVSTFVYSETIFLCSYFMSIFFLESILSSIFSAYMVIRDQCRYMDHVSLNLTQLQMHRDRVFYMVVL